MTKRNAIKETSKLIYFMLLLALTTNLVAIDKYKATADLKVRKEPNSKSHSLGLIKNGDTIVVIDKTNPEWFKTEYKNKAGFISSKFLALIPEVKVESISLEPKTENTGLSTTTIVLIGLGALVIGLIIYLISNKNKSDDEPVNSNVSGFYKIYTPNGLKLVRKLEEMQANNETLMWTGEVKLYQKLFGDLKSTKDLDEYERAVGISGYIDANEGSLKQIAGDYITNLAADLAQRHTAQYYKLESVNEQEALEKYNLNIHSDEFIHSPRIKDVDWFEEKTITTSVSYGGFQYKIGSGPFSYRTGSLSVSPNKTQKFERIDRGFLYITNKRIIFVGTENRVNKSIKLDDVLEFSVFKDGILIGKSNGKKPLIQFPEWIVKPNTSPNKRDHLNRVVRILDRVISKTQNETDELQIANDTKQNEIGEKTV